MTNYVEIEGTVKEPPVYRRNRTDTRQATFEICHETHHGSRLRKNWFRIAAHNAVAKHVVEGSRELGRGLIPGDRVLIHGRLGAHAKKCGNRACKLRHNHWWINIDNEDGGSIELVARSLSETREPPGAGRRRRR